MGFGRKAEAPELRAAGLSPAALLDKAAALAFDLHCRGVAHAKVEERGAEPWFRACPLRIHSQAPMAASHS